MKNITVKALLIAGLISIVSSFSSSDDSMNVETKKNMVKSKEASKAKTYNIRYGLLSQNGTKILSGSYAGTRRLGRIWFGNG